MKKQTCLLISGIILFLCGSTALADIGFSAYSFESLFENSDCVVAGKVVDTRSDLSGYTMIFSVSEVLYGSASSVVTVQTPFHNGAACEDYPYLSKGQQCIIFLRSSGGAYEIVNRVGGVAHPELLDDITLAAHAFAGNKALFDKANLAHAKEVFQKMQYKETKRRCLESMRGKYTESDAAFLLGLLSSGEQYLQKYAAIQAGYAKITSLRTDIEQKCVSTSNTALKTDLLYATALFEDPRSKPLILDALEDSDKRVRNMAVFAAGLVGDNDFTEPLTNIFHFEKNDLDRYEIITSLGRLKDKAESRHALSNLRNMDMSERMKSFIDNTISKLE